MDNHEDFLPEHAIRDYRNSPVENKSLQEQILYWRTRAKLFENRAYKFSEIIKNIEERDDSGDWWKKDQEDE